MNRTPEMVYLNRKPKPKAENPRTERLRFAFFLSDVVVESSATERSCVGEIDCYAGTDEVEDPWWELQPLLSEYQ